MALPAAADAAGDVLAAQFVARRLAPAGSAKRKASGSVRWADPMAVRVVVESRPGQEAEIQIYHSLENSVSGHMQADVETFLHEGSLRHGKL